MKNIYILSFFMLFSGTLHSQIVTIKDLNTRKPLESVSLMSESPNAFAFTNSNGQTDISIFKGAQEIEIRTMGHETIVLSYAEIQSRYFELLLKRSELELEEVVVSGTRWKQSSNNVPAKIILIPQVEIDLQNPQTAADLLGISGKVFIQKSQQGGGSPMIRGFATNRLLYTIDGVRMNTAIFRGGNLQNVISLDPFAVENAEVLFGPGSVIYGSDAIGGVMAFQTLTPKLSPSEKDQVSGKAISRYSSANKENTGHVDVNVGWDKWAMVTSFSSWDYDNLQQGGHGPDEYLKPYYVQRQSDGDKVVFQENPLLQIPSAYSQMNLMQKLRYAPNESWDFQFGFHYSETSSYGRYDRHNRTKNGMARYAEWNYGPQKWMMNSLNISHSRKRLLYDDMIIRIALQSFEESRIDRTLNKNARTTQTENVDAYSVNLDLTKSISYRHKLFYGLEYVFDDIASSGFTTDISDNSKTKASARYPQSNWSSLAAYINDEFKLSNNFTLQAGARYNQYRLNADFINNISFYPFPFSSAIINNGALTGSVGGVYRPSVSWVISGNLGTAFRSPNIDDIGKIFDSEPGAVTVPNPGLKSEYAYNFDLGIARVFENFLKIDLTGYYTLLQNAMVRRDFRLNGQDSIIYDGEMSRVQAIQNAAVARVHGLQMGIEVKLPAGFTLTSDLNYQSGEEELDDGTISPSRHAAPLFGTTHLNFKANKLYLQFYSSYQAERKYEHLAMEERNKDEIYAKDAKGNNYSPAWYTLNIKAMLELSKTLSLGAGIENLSDQRYRLYSSGISAPGRNFVISLKAVF